MRKSRDDPHARNRNDLLVGGRSWLDDWRPHRRQSTLLYKLSAARCEEDILYHNSYRIRQDEKVVARSDFIWDNEEFYFFFIVAHRSSENPHYVVTTVAHYRTFIPLFYREPSNNLNQDNYSNYFLPTNFVFFMTIYNFLLPISNFPLPLKLWLRFLRT